MGASGALRIFEEVGSTNDVVRELAEKGGAHGAAVAARRQTAGRGRRGHVWESPLGNLYLSNITESNFYSKNMIAGIELVKFIVRFPVGNRAGKKQHDNPSRVALIRQY